MTLRLPSLAAPVLDEAGLFSQAWTGFLRSLVGRPGPILDVHPTASGMVYTASGNGTLAVTGGMGVTLALMRGRVAIQVPAGGPLPLSDGDAVRVGYTTAPQISFVPGVL